MSAPKTYRGQTDVMNWCGGVNRAAISNWFSRHPDTVPQPDVIIVNEKTNQVTRGWLPERRAEWEKFAADRKSADRSAGASAAARRARSTAALIRKDAEAGRIDPLVAISLLSELIGGQEPGER